MASDPSALLPLVLWLLVLVARRRVRRLGLGALGTTQTWLIAVTVLLVALWGASDIAAMLLPNLM